MNQVSFKNITIVACGTLILELSHLKRDGFLDTEHLFYTTPGLHQDGREPKRQLLQRIDKAREKANKVIVVFGGKFCYVNIDDPTKTMRRIIEEQGPDVAPQIPVHQSATDHWI